MKVCGCVDDSRLKGVSEFLKGMNDERGTKKRTSECEHKKRDPCGSYDLLFPTQLPGIAKMIMPKICP